jgi:UDP-N-acetylglucosamine diphosphorylase/glucosamine-1-phosphate N-acetyltransferase
MPLTLVIFEDEGYRDLLPLVYWRTTGELRTGYDRLLDYLLAAVPGAGSVLYCRPMLAAVAAERLRLPVNTEPADERVLFLNSRLLLTGSLKVGPCPSVQWAGDDLIALNADRALAKRVNSEVLLSRTRTRQVLADVPAHEFISSPRLIRYPWNLVHANVGLLSWCWQRSGAGELAGRICEGAHLLNRCAIHVGEGSTIKPGVVLDAEHGPIFIGRRVTVSPNCSIEGPCFIGDDSLIQPGAVLRDGMSIGRRCKVGGELESSVIHGYSNKQHDGFLGHSYLGEWVNLAADTVNSDLKNTYGPIRVPINGVEVDSGEMFVGLTMGDHSKTGIGQMFPTGTVVGFGCNIATCEFSPKFVPSFTWLTGQGSSRYDVNRCLEVARKVMARRQVELTAVQEDLFRRLPLCAREHEQGSPDGSPMPPG